MLHHLKIHFKKMRPKKFFFRSMSLDPTKPRKKLTDQQTFQKKSSTQLPFLFPSKFCLFQAWLLYLCDGFYYPRRIPTIAPFCSHGTNPLDLWKFCTLELQELGSGKLKGGKILGGEPIARWWQLKYLLFSTPTWGKVPIWLIFFRWVETTN